MFTELRDAASSAGMNPENITQLFNNYVKPESAMFPLFVPTVHDKSLKHYLLGKIHRMNLQFNAP
ncbi:MAG: hypothetical protein AAGG59_15855 [Bacteroidota bacterium]